LLGTKFATPIRGNRIVAFIGIVCSSIVALSKTFTCKLEIVNPLGLRVWLAGVIFNSSPVLGILEKIMRAGVRIVEFTLSSIE